MSRYSKDYDNSTFYHSAAWKKVSRCYMLSQNYICERCGSPAVICHHKHYLDGDNVKDPNIALNFNNLEALCIDCHNAEHSRKQSVVIFDDNGSIAGVKESGAVKDFKKQAAAIDDLLLKLNKQRTDNATATQSDETATPI